MVGRVLSIVSHLYGIPVPSSNPEVHLNVLCQNFRKANDAMRSDPLVWRVAAGVARLLCDLLP